MNSARKSKQAGLEARCSVNYTEKGEIYTMYADVLILEHSMLVRLNRVSIDVIEGVSQSLNITYVVGDVDVRVRGSQQDLWVFLHNLSTHYASLTIV